jgi:TPR repeat protein
VLPLVEASVRTRDMGNGRKTTKAFGLRVDKKGVRVAGSASAMYLRALALARRGTAAARREALPLLEQSVALGDKRAIYALGTWYAFGVTVKKDFARAADLFERAARNGHADAQFDLAVCFERGRGARPEACCPLVPRGGQATRWG